MWELMRLSEFLQETNSARISQRNSKERMVKYVNDAIDKYLRPLYVHI